MKRKPEWPSVLDTLPILIIIAIAALLPALLFLGPSLISYLSSLHLPALPALNWTQAPPSGNMSIKNDSVSQISPEAEKYYRLKNLSCATLSKNFLIATSDISTGDVSGLLNSSPAESAAAQSIASQYDYDQTVRTHVRGNWMKKIIETGGIEHTTIWKEGRIYQCNPACTMHLLGIQAGSLIF